MQSTTDHARWRGGKPTDRLFIIAVIFKGIDGALGIIGGAILAFVKPPMLNWLAAVLTTHELSRNPHNVIATLFVHSVAELDVSKLAFAAAYLFIHGTLKTFLAIMLLIGRPWSYPAGISFLGVFVLYTAYRLHLHWSWILFGFMAFDIVTIFLVFREWRIQRAHWQALTPPPAATAGS